MINVFQPSLGELELAAVKETFDSNWIGRGSRTEEFESVFARHIGVPRDRVRSINSCTEAMFLAMELAGVDQSSDVVLPTVSFVGAGNAISARGATPVFCDVDPRTLNPSVDDVEAVLTSRTKAVVILHYGGYPGDVARIAELCRKRGVLLIEDAAIAVASTVEGQSCGTFGDLAVWSFDHGKIVVTVDGGMLYAREPELAERARTLSYLGLEQSSGYDQARNTDNRWWDFDVSAFSRRSVTNDVLAAVGTVQMSRLPDFIRRREEIAARYENGLAGIEGLQLPPPLPAGHETSHYMYWVQFDHGIRDIVARDLYNQGIYTTFRYPPLHKVPAYGSQAELPGADYAAERTLLLPMHHSLTDEDVDRTINEVREITRNRLKERRPA
ncbi:DegT/DnrJ/EryC1/StrS family aminotransferase [Actinopolyspora mzabensis]|nr:DegT/DnrJ/EryC1/StrS family aminotransferase [Actinopolyspora mzabensis]